MSKTIRDYLDIVKVKGGYGEVSKAAVNVLKGHNHRGGGNIVPANKDHQGYTFFTKPNLNLSYYNLTMARRLTFLANNDPTSMASAIRCMLSPHVLDNWGMSTMPIYSTMPGAEELPRSQFVDDRYPFIPVLSNTLVSLSGWPDLVADVMNSKEGLRKETVSWVDSIGDIYSSFDLTANFQNMDGNPVLTLIAAWVEYATRVAEGSMNPYASMIVENEIDYQTRIYRIVLDPTKTFVRQIAEVGVAFPSAVPFGANFNYTQDALFNNETEQISMRFSCTGVRYNDPISIYNFNRIVETFNSSMREGKRSNDMKLLKPNELQMFNYSGFPRINDNYQFEWWVTNEEYARVLASMGIKAPEATGSLDTLGVPETLNINNIA